MINKPFNAELNIDENWIPTEPILHNSNDQDY